MSIDSILRIQARIAAIDPGLARRQTSQRAVGTDFAATLTAAQGAAQPSSAQPVSGVNGQLDESALSPIGVGNHRLQPRAAAAFRQLRAAAATAGIEIGVTDSYRDYDQQVDLARRKGLYSQGGLAAVPGTSQHGWGLALDLDVDSQGLAWLRENASRFGFYEDVPREPWHWEFEHGIST